MGPPRGGSRAEGSRGPQPSHRRQHAHECDAVRVPPPAELGPEDQQALGPAGHEFGVAAPFADRRRRHSSAVHVAGLVDGVSGAPKGGHQGDVARQGFATCGCAVDEEVQPALVIGWHSERGADQPGLGNNASFRANSFASHPDPGMLKDMGPAGEEAALGAGERVVSKPVQRASASVLARRAAAPGRSHRQGCAESPPQRDVHEGWGQREARLAGNGREPRAGMGSSLGTEQGSG